MSGLAADAARARRRDDAFLPTVCPGHSRPVVGCHFQRDDVGGTLYMISASLDKKPMLRNGDTGDWIGTFEGHKGAVWSAKLNASVTRAATGAADFSAKIWDAIDGTELCTLKHRHIVKSVAFSRDDRRLVTGARDKKLRVFDLEAACSGGGGGDGVGSSTGEGGDGTSSSSSVEPVTVCEHPKGVTRAEYTSDTNLVFTGCDDGMLRTWDMRSGQVVQTLQFRSGVSDLDVSLDDTMLAVSAGKEVHFFDATAPGRLVPLKTHACKLAIESVALHPNKRAFLTAGTDLWVHQWSYETLEEVEVKKGHHGPVHTVRYAPHGESFASGADDATLRLWTKRDRLERQTKVEAKKETEGYEGEQ